MKGRPLVTCRNLDNPGRAARAALAPQSALTLMRPSGPAGGGASPSQGRPYGIFKRAIQRRNVPAVLAAARELPQLSLLDSLDLTMLVARTDPARHPRVAAAGCCGS